MQAGSSRVPRRRDLGTESLKNVQTSLCSMLSRTKTLRVWQRRASFQTRKYAVPEMCEVGIII
eukprot:286205-Pelagomonas_calceolata.AAC.2